MLQIWKGDQVIILDEKRKEGSALIITVKSFWLKFVYIFFAGVLYTARFHKISAKKIVKKVSDFSNEISALEKKEAEEIRQMAKHEKTNV